MKKIIGVVLVAVYVLLVGCDKAAQETQVKPASHLMGIKLLNPKQPLPPAEKESTTQEHQVKPASHLMPITLVNTKQPATHPLSVKVINTNSKK